MKYLAKYGHWIFLVLMALEIWEVYLHGEGGWIKWLLVAGWGACFLIFQWMGNGPDQNDELLKNIEKYDKQSR